MSSAELNRKVTRSDLGAILTGVVFGSVISILVFTQNYPTGEFVCAFVAAYAFGVIFHEFGHAVAALAVGGTVETVRLGQPVEGRTPWRIRFLGLGWTIHGLPFSGGVHSTVDRPEHFRLRRCVIVAAGPAANALLVTLGGAATFLVPSNQPEPMLILAGWMFANGYICINNLTPRLVRSRGQMVPNDGLNIMQTLRQSDDEIRRAVAASVLARDFQLDTAAAQKMPTEELFARYEADPKNISLLWNLTIKLHLTDDPRYPECVMKLIALPGLPDTAVPNLIDECLTWQLHRGPPEKPEFADELSTRLLNLDESVSTRGTRGSVLIDIGRIDEGKAMLGDVLAKTDSSIDKSYSHIFLALADEAEGKLDDARQHATIAKDADPTCQALKRVSHLLETNHSLKT